MIKPICVVLAGLALLVGGAPAWAVEKPSVTGMNTFIHHYKDSLSNVLLETHRARIKRKSDDGAYIILGALDTGWGGQSYVQCHLGASHEEVYCEGSSGFYEFKSPLQRRHLPAGMTHAIAATGFDLATGRKGNFVQRIPTDGSPVRFDAVATTMLETLYRAYGGRVGAVTLKAPFFSGDALPFRPERSGRCDCDS